MARTGLAANLHAIHMGFLTAGVVTLLMLFIPFVERQLKRQSGSDQIDWVVSGRRISDP
jgi:hypothetical protein